MVWCMLNSLLSEQMCINKQLNLGQFMTINNLVFIIHVIMNELY